uniref:Nudix hydrolase domain-containing protein n=1 Tax=viral metagenome TaxID=1070528 RepID=A0A6C0H644_9ZZZZ
MNDTCNNCGKYGHQSNQCLKPITSCGIILFKKVDGCLNYLMVRRKHSFSFIDFIHGNYLSNNYIQLQKIFDEMSIFEKELIRDNNFSVCWEYCWGKKKYEFIFEKKFGQIKSGFYSNDKKIIVDVNYLINNSNQNWQEPEWEFPKGKKNNGETEEDCAFREFKEETGFSNDIHIAFLENIIPFEEIFFGSNFKSYKTKYFLYKYLGNNQENMQNFQKSEIGNMKWMTFDECNQYIRNYQTEKHLLIHNVNNCLLEFSHIL